MAGAKKKKTAEIGADHAAEISRVRKIIGQLEGIEKMILNQRHPLQIIQQVKAASSALIALRIEVLKRHLHDCLNEATQSGDNTKLVGQVIETVEMQVGK